jgi:hypothetical protein
MGFFVKVANIHHGGCDDLDIVGFALRNMDVVRSFSENT